MTKVVSISPDDEPLEIASRWVLKMDEGALRSGDAAALGAWLDENVRHRELLMEVATVWDKVDALARLAELFPHGSGGNQVRRGLAHQPWGQGLAAAAGLAVLVIAGLLLLSPSGNRAHPTTLAEYVTAIGERKTLLLPDGSEVVLNTNSRLAVALTPTSRLLHLAQGEILVRVAEDPTRPLSVVAGNRVMQAVGTEFVVEITDDHRVELMVTEGKVAFGIQSPMVSPPGGGIDALDAAVAPPVLANPDNIVAAGESVLLGEAEPVRRTTVSADEIEARLSWQGGRLIFRSEPLERALNEIERYTTVEFVLLDESLRSRTLSGRFRTDDVEALLLSLRANFDIAHEFDGESRVLLSSL